MLKFIDLFAGIGGMRLGFESACKDLGIDSKCVFSSEIKKTASEVYEKNFNDIVYGDISKIKSEEIPKFDFLLAGFPCQAFSTAGRREGFLDTRGTLFFEIERILEYHLPQGFILENVDNLINHNQGKTFNIIKDILIGLGYQITWGILNSKDYGVPQERKRIYIVGLKQKEANLGKLTLRKDNIEQTCLNEILEANQPTLTDNFSQRLLTYFSPQELQGKAINDKRGGKNNIHSWEICIKGEISQEQKEILNLLLKIRRYKKWSLFKGIKWMDGMPLTLEEITMYYTEHPNLEFPKNLRSLLDDLVDKGYLKLEHPKDIIENKRLPRKDLPKGYNLVTGKLSFPISQILDPEKTAPTLTATDMCKIAVIDGNGLRKLTVREGLRLFGFPENYNINSKKEVAYNLLGNSVVVPVIEDLSYNLLLQYLK